MNDKKHTYQSDTLALPPLRMVLGEVPEPDPDDINHQVRAFNKDKSEMEARLMVKKLIRHLKKNEK
ncbi:MAG TPA: hypothetical protein VGK00_13740 [Anaerolineales bacterium]|jgi:hypothetical protein